MKPIHSVTSIKELLAHLPEDYTEDERELVKRAYQVAEEAHREQKRHSGEPYINHCVAVASILANLKVPSEAVIAGLLHDTVEDTVITLEDIRREFGETVKNLVDGVTKLTHMPHVARGDQHAERGAVEEKLDAPALLGRKEDIVAETLRKTFVAMSKDVRVMFIKLADRLHNMRTLGHMPEHKRLRIAQETFDIFAPVASRLGIWQIKWELEDLSFFYTNPERYKEIESMLAEDRAAREAKLENIKKNILTVLKKHNIPAEISGRPKHIYSIYKKMMHKDKSFDALRDLRAVRLIVPTEQDCYIALGVIHSAWKPIPKEFDDYIAAPKTNNYKSLHTAVFYENDPLEVQIRTREMHLNSEYGFAVHWRYKHGGKRDAADAHHDMFLSNLRSMVKWSADVRDATEFVESIQSEVIKERVYVFTPRGDPIDLPEGSTPIDFAYHVHTDVGHRCGGARVNGKMISLNYKLKTGDRIEILTTKRGGPSRDWLNPNLGLVETQRARSKITLWFKKLEDATNIAQGRVALENECHKLGLSEKVNFEKTARNLNYKTPEDMFLALGNGDLLLNKVVKRLAPNEEIETEEFFKINPSAAKASSEIMGLKGMLSITAQCCNPMPGNQIIGYVTRGRGVSVHRKDCPNVKKIKDRERLLQIRWGYKESAYPVPIKIKALDRPGLIGEITGMLSADGVNISNADLRTDKTEADVNLTIDVKDISQLSRVLSRIGTISGVMEAHRVKPG